MAATIRDIRDRTGLSLATISKYLNGGNVLPENRKAIAKAIEELHYEVNEVARGLATRRTKTIGVLIHSFENVFAGTIISNIENILRQHGYGTIVCDCQGDKNLEAEELLFLLGKRVDGIITIPLSGDSAYLKPAFERNIPVVLIDRAFSDREMDCVLVDNVSAARQAVQVLLENGHRRVAIVCGDETEFTARERLKGYEQALAEYQIPPNPALIKRGKLTVEHGYLSMKELLEMEDRPTAVFMSNYEITLGGIVAVNELSVAFPDEISLIGFDNFLLSKVVNPPLWMVSQPMEKIAITAARLMLEKLDEAEKEDGAKPEVRKIILETSIFRGESIQHLL